MFDSWFMVAIFRYLMVNDSWLCAGVQTYIISPRPFFGRSMPWRSQKFGVVSHWTAIEWCGIWWCWLSTMRLNGVPCFSDKPLFFFFSSLLGKYVKLELWLKNPNISRPSHFWAPEFSIIFTHPMPDWLSLLTILPVHVHGIRWESMEFHQGDHLKIAHKSSQP